MSLQSFTRSSLAAFVSSLLQARGPGETTPPRGFAGCCFGEVPVGSLVISSLASDPDVGFGSSHWTERPGVAFRARDACIRIDTDLDVAAPSIDVIPGTEPTDDGQQSTAYNIPYTPYNARLSFSDLYAIRDGGKCEQYDFISNPFGAASRACVTLPYNDPLGYAQWGSVFLPGGSGDDEATDFEPNAFTTYHTLSRSIWGERWEDTTDPVPTMLVGQQQINMQVIRSLVRRGVEIEGVETTVEAAPMAARGAIYIHSSINGYRQVDNTSQALCINGQFRVSHADAGGGSINYPQISIAHDQPRIEGVNSIISQLVNSPAQVRVYLSNQMIIRTDPYEFWFEHPGVTGGGSDFNGVEIAPNSELPVDGDMTPDGRTRAIVEVWVPETSDVYGIFPGVPAAVSPYADAGVGGVKPVRFASHVDVNAVGGSNNEIDDREMIDIFQDGSDALGLDIRITMSNRETPWAWVSSDGGLIEPSIFNGFDMVIRSSDPLIECGCIAESNGLEISDPANGVNCEELVYVGGVACRAYTETFDQSVSFDGAHPDDDSPGGGGGPDEGDPGDGEPLPFPGSGGATPIGGGGSPGGGTTIPGIPGSIGEGGDGAVPPCDDEDTAAGIAAALGIDLCDLCPNLC